MIRSPWWGFAERLGCFLVCVALALFLLVGTTGCHSGARVELGFMGASVALQFAGPELASPTSATSATPGAVPLSEKTEKPVDGDPPSTR